MDFKDYYKILGVDRKATKSEIKKKYRELAKKYHPDANQNNKEAEAKFKEISEAYDILGNKEKKEKYDQLLKYGMGNNRKFYQKSSNFENMDFQNIFGGLGGNNFESSGSFSDIFESFFGQSQSPGKKRGNRGEDIEITTSITFEQAVKGGTLKLGVPQKSPCPVCNGSGGDLSKGFEICPTCRGKGKILDEQMGFSVKKTCPTCLGKGKFIKKTCNTCGGKGTITKKKTIKVKVPEGVDTGHKIRIPGEGNKGTGSAPDGNLIVKIKVIDNPNFVRHGRDITTNTNITFVDAILGTKKKIKTIDGEIILKIPAGVQPGTKLKVKNKGIKSNGIRGNLFVIINILIPKEITDKGKELLKDINKECKF